MSELILGFPSIVTTRRVVPNMFPPMEPTGYRIALVGEAPGEHEENHRQPFVGPSGNFLNSMLHDEGINRHQCFVGNVCQVRPPGNRIESFSWNGEEIQGGVAQLIKDLETFRPHIVVTLGNLATHVAKTLTSPQSPTGVYSWPFNVSAWCGSLHVSPTFGVKSIPAFHPAFILRQWNHNYPRTRWALARALTEGAFAPLELPQRELITDLTAGELEYRMDNWPAGQPCSIDLEGGIPEYLVNEGVKFDAQQRRHLNWKCVALAARPTRAFAIRWFAFTVPEHVRLLRSFVRLMARRDVPKILQTSLYEQFVLAYGYHMVIRNVQDDTMLKGWETFSELPKSLGVQASVYTREPHWKDDEMYGGTGDQLARGCCLDTCVTYEISNAHDAQLDTAGQAHYRFNLAMLDPLRFMSLKGIRYDKKNAEEKTKAVQEEIKTVGETLSNLAGANLRGAKGSLSSTKLASCLYQLAPSFTGTGKRKQQDLWSNSPYPAQYKKEAGRKTEKLTTDVEALLNLARNSPTDSFLGAILRHRHLEGLLETLAIKTDPDGRVRCGYNVVGTETGRLTCYTSPTGAGANLTTITKSLRGNYTADSGYDFFQIDLEGADGWTVACHCARLGDRRMLEDYRAGMKPAKIIGLLYWFGPVINDLCREDVKWLHDRVLPLVVKLAGKWLYMACKRVQHGSNYLMGIPTMIKQVLLDGYKYGGTPIYIEHADAKRLQNLYFSRYPGVRTWHQWAEAKLIADGKLTSASGHTRVFFGPRYGPRLHDTLKEFLADEPQQNTTYAINLTALRLWNDPENRGSNGSLTVESLHQVHDALCGQWPQSCREWARRKVREWAHNEIEIAGTKIVIPVDGSWGPCWDDGKVKLEKI